MAALREPGVSLSLSSISILFVTVSFCVVLLFSVQHVVACTRILTSDDVLSLSGSQCVVAISNNHVEQTTQNHGASTNLLTIADVAFLNDPGVFVGVCDLHNFIWPSGKPLITDEQALEFTAVIFSLLLEDRTCLQKPFNNVPHPDANFYRGPTSADAFVNFVNTHCNAFREPNGHLSIEGHHRQYLLDNLFSVQEIPNSATISEIFEKRNLKQRGHCLKKEESGESLCSDQLPSTSEKLFESVPKCERIPMPGKEDFLTNYLFRSKPVIIEDAMKDWPTISKWSNDFFRSQYGKQEVHIKLTPKGEYEGIEPANIWESFQTFEIPSAVLKQLPYPDLVVVRPAEINLNFSDFLNLVQNISEGTLKNVSAYLEYTAIADYFPELKDDVAEMPFIEKVLKLAHLNIWLSDGNTLGKTHFDPFDNFLCQIHGEKEVTLFEPHNDFLYEAHIPEAMLSYNATLKRFRRSTLLSSTSMVMTPVDILKPHLERFPKFGAARPLSCTIKEGDVLFMPAFWWHEVQSRPNPSLQRNLAVNFWYAPFFQKEFPCPECHLDVNPKYRHLL